MHGVRRCSTEGVGYVVLINEVTSQIIVDEVKDRSKCVVGSSRDENGSNKSKNKVVSFPTRKKAREVDEVISFHDKINEGISFPKIEENKRISFPKIIEGKGISFPKSKEGEGISFPKNEEVEGISFSKIEEGEGISFPKIENEKNEVLLTNEDTSTEIMCNCGRNRERSFYSERSRQNKEQMVSFFEHVHASGLPNYQGCRIPLFNSKFNIKLWRKRLTSYHDRIVCEFLEFGFPLDFDRSKTVSDNVRRNHKGARDYPEFITNYIKKECSAGRMIGPFTENPLSVPLIVSPLNTVPKSSKDERRVIVDLSWPHGASINDGISKDRYLGETINYHYASVAEICEMVRQVGPGAVIYKRDLRHAYRQIPVDPGDYCYLGYAWEDSLYMDSVLVMGQRNAAMGCSRTTNAVMYMHAQDGYKGGSYLDDLIGVALASNGQEAYESLGELLNDLGLLENFEKACPPSTVQLVLGILIDTVNGTLSVPPEKMIDIVELLNLWKGKLQCTKVELQSLIGILQFITKCVQASRVFLNRMLELLRSMRERNTVKLSESFIKDLLWWNKFVHTYNGVSFIPDSVWSEPDIAFSTDSSLKGTGGICGFEFFHATYPDTILLQQLPIHCLEMISVLIAVRIWGHHFPGLKVQIFCDNEAVVSVINSSRTKDPFMGACLREIWFSVSTHGFELRAVHLPGVENRVADWLSRWNYHPRYKQNFLNFIKNESDRYTEISIGIELFEFSNDL